MAISLTCYQLLKLLKDRGELPQGGRILEIGKANWYGDANTDAIFDEVKAIEDENRRFQVANWLAKNCHDADTFGIVRRIYDVLFQAYTVISLDQDREAVKRGAYDYDLNTLDWRNTSETTFETVINHGTAEHVFNIANVFKVMHDACEVGGLMIHESPFTGWQSHGFYNLQPTLFYDLARENSYEMVLLATEHLRSRTYQEYESHEAILAAKYRDKLPDHSMLFVAMRRKSEGLFKVPTQGIYAGAASQFVQQMWGALR